MKTRSSAHVHTQFCDGKNTAEEMVLAALERGFVSLGFSSHAAQPFDDRYPPRNEQPYKDEIRRLQKVYRDRIRIYLGAERDFYALPDMKDYDYFIASVHYMPGGDKHYGIDFAPEHIQEYVDRYCGGNGFLLARQYFETLAAYVEKIHPSIIGHFDLVRKNNAKNHWYDEDSKAYRTLALDALKRVFSSGALLEVNTGGIARGYLPTPYPDLFLLKEWKNWGGEVIVNSDCHQAPLIDAAYDQAEEMLRGVGYASAVRLGGGAEKWERYLL